MTAQSVSEAIRKNMLNGSAQKVLLVNARTFMKLLEFQGVYGFRWVVCDSDKIFSGVQSQTPYGCAWLEINEDIRDGRMKIVDNLTTHEKANGIVNL